MSEDLIGKEEPHRGHAGLTEKLTASGIGMQRAADHGAASIKVVQKPRETSLRVQVA
jgi:hypothetical protein